MYYIAALHDTKTVYVAEQEFSLTEDEFSYSTHIKDDALNYARELAETLDYSVTVVKSDGETVENM